MESNSNNSSKRNHPTWFYVTIALICIAIATALVVLVLNKTTTSPFDTNGLMENWFSFFMTLIGICTTFMVASQVLNFIEVKKMVSEADIKMKDLEKLETEIKEIAEKSENNNVQMDEKANDMANLFYIQSETMPNEEPLDKALCLIFSLTSLVYPYKKADVLIFRLQKLQSNLMKVGSMTEKWKDVLAEKIDKLEKIDVPADCPQEKRLELIAIKGNVLSMLYTLTKK